MRASLLICGMRRQSSHAGPPNPVQLREAGQSLHTLLPLLEQKLRGR